jgi:hypothetical protein
MEVMFMTFSKVVWQAEKLPHRSAAERCDFFCDGGSISE